MLARPGQRGRRNGQIRPHAETEREIGGYLFLKTCPKAAEGMQLADDIRELVGRCQRGDEDAARTLIDHFRDQVFGLCFRMLGHRQDAEDVAQESFVRALRSLGRWDQQREFKPWLMAIAANRCRSMLALRSRRPGPLAEMDHLPDPSPDQQLARNLNEEIGLALNQLREEYRQAFLLFHSQQFSYAEIAEALACPVGTVKTWVHRARRELAERLRTRGLAQELPRCDAPNLKPG
jgi:RNA polymerase sigma-70 factor (ECF subfamily)